MNVNVDNFKSYATEANLLKAIAKAGFGDWNFIVVCNRYGRFCAIAQHGTRARYAFMGQ